MQTKQRFTFLTTKDEYNKFRQELINHNISAELFIELAYTYELTYPSVRIARMHVHRQKLKVQQENTIRREITIDDCLHKELSDFLAKNRILAKFFFWYYAQNITRITEHYQERLVY